MSDTPRMSRLPLDRFRPLLWLGAVFFAIEFLTRLALLIKTGGGVPPSLASWLYVFGVGAFY
ncbi:MAG TPA: hypothetical protein VF407_14655, partial [Polyangiaceae bacterium]